jgi:hypothetical protein
VAAAWRQTKTFFDIQTTCAANAPVNRPNPILLNHFTRSLLATALSLALALALALGTSVFAQPSNTSSESAALQNWFNDPFFQFTAAVADCPVPVGPFIRADERASQAHRRAEKGTSCWLAGTCERPNAYEYDADIAKALKAALKVNQLYTHSPLVNSSLWATVQGRIVTIEGCMAGDAYTSFDHDMITTQIANVAKSIPNVLQAVVLVRTSGQTKIGAPVPYKARP